MHRLQDIKPTTDDEEARTITSEEKEGGIPFMRPEQAAKQLGGLLALLAGGGGGRRVSPREIIAQLIEDLREQRDWIREARKRILPLLDDIGGNAKTIIELLCELKGRLSWVYTAAVAVRRDLLVMQVTAAGEKAAEMAAGGGEGALKKLLRRIIRGAAPVSPPPEIFEPVKGLPELMGEIDMLIYWVMQHAKRREGEADIVTLASDMILAMTELGPRILSVFHTAASCIDSALRFLNLHCYEKLIEGERPIRPPPPPRSKE